MLGFINSKLTKMTGKDKQSHIFQKSKPYEIIGTVIYIGEEQEFIIHVFYWFILLDHEIYTKCKKTSTLFKGISGHNICSGIKSQQVKIHLPFSTKNFWFFSAFLCSISLSHFRSFNFMRAFREHQQKTFVTLSGFWPLRG